MSEISKRHIFDLVGPAVARSLHAGPQERHEQYAKEIRTALEEFESLLKCEELADIMYSLLKARVRGDSTADFLELVEVLLRKAESVIDLPSEEEAYES